MIALAVHQIAHQLAIAVGSTGSGGSGSGGAGSGLIPDPAPAAPDGAGALTTLLAWIKYGALICCAGAAVTAGGMIALGNTSRRAELAERGKVTLICAVFGAIVVAVAGTLITSSYGLG